MQPLKITVVTVSYNAAATIEETIRSVVDQTYDNIEYIIIDGGSTDGTVDIVRKYAEGGSEASNHRHRITYWVSEPDRGIYDAMNKGIAAAAGDYINFMNAGDRFVDNKTLEKVSKKMKDSLHGVYFGDMIFEKRNAHFTSTMTPFFLSKKRIRPMGICHQSIFTQVDLAKLFKFDDSFKIAADYNMIATIYNHGYSFFKLNMPIAIYDTEGISSINAEQRFKEEARINGISTKSFIVKIGIINIILRKGIKYILKTINIDFY